MISVMAAVMAVQAAMVYQVQYKTAIAHTAGIVGAVMLFVFEGAFTIGFQATVWVYPSEILPLRLRQKGSSISTASNWICNYLIVQVTPPAIENIGWRTYIIFAVLNVGRHLLISLSSALTQSTRPPGFLSFMFSFLKVRDASWKTSTGSSLVKRTTRQIESPSWWTRLRTRPLLLELEM